MRRQSVFVETSRDGRHTLRSERESRTGLTKSGNKREKRITDVRRDTEREREGAFVLIEPNETDQDGGSEDL